MFYFQGNLDKVDFKKDYLILNPKSNFTTFKIHNSKKILKILKTNKIKTFKK